jgi:hypothetical protein
MGAYVAQETVPAHVAILMALEVRSFSSTPQREKFAGETT